MAGEASELPRKILMTADAVGGVWQYAVDLCSALAQRGIEVRVATLGPAATAEQLQTIESVPGISVAHGNFALEWMEDPWREVDEAGEWLQSQQRAFGADLIHLNGFAHAALEWEVPVLCVAHSCVRSWWRAVHRVEAGPEWAEYTRRVTAGLEASSLVVTPSAAMARSLSEEYGTGPGKIRVIHNASRMPECKGKQKEGVVLAAGRVWDRAKNFELLDEIASEIDWPIRVAGDEGSGRSPGRLQMLGKLSHTGLEEQLRAASIFAHPALYEPFGLSVLEAARARCCLALSNIPSLRELWDGAAVFLDPRDPEMWAFEMRELCGDFSRRRRIGDLAAKRAQRYGPDAMLGGYLNVYTSLLSKGAKAEAAG